LSSFSLNSAVLAWSSASESFWMSFSSALIASTFGLIRRTARSWEVPNSFLITQVIIATVPLEEQNAGETRPGPGREAGES
jgi:Na+-translocating ferredoxin:NAD+ oxidoreductase RnfD subunit